MAYNCEGVSFGVCRARFTKVGANGAVVAGSNSYVTDNIGEVTVAVNKETGNSVSVRNGCGCSIARKKFPDTFNWFELTITFRAMEPAMEALLLGANTIADGADIVGLAFQGALDCDEVEPAVAVEFWTLNQVGSGQDGTYPYFHWVFPKVKLTPGDSAFGENNADRVFVGNSETNQQWGDGPYGDGPPDGEDIRDGGWWASDIAPPAAGCATATVTSTS